MNKNTIIALVIGAVVLIGAVYMLFFSTKPQEGLTGDVPTSAEEAVFVNLTNQLEPLKFETGILRDLRFTALVDIHTDVLPEGSFRRDPFAPLSK